MEDFNGEDHPKQNTTEAAVDSLSALPVEVIYQIMEHLTLQDAARMSALSSSWRKNWLSMPCMVFDWPFFRLLRSGVKRRSERGLYSIIHRILLLHEGPIVKFTTDFAFPDMDISPWLSYISKSVRELTVSANFKESSSHVLFSCSKLRILTLLGGTITIPPPTFTGFRNLVTLELVRIEASGDDVFGSIIHTSSKLEKLVLCDCRGLGDIVIDFPLLRYLKISGTWKSIYFKSAPNLKVASLSEVCVKGLDYEKALTQFIGSLIHTSSQLEDLRLPDKGFKDIVLDSPLLRILVLSGSWQSICFKNAPNLTMIILSGQSVEDLDYEKAPNLINFLASSCTIETLILDGTFCELFLERETRDKLLTFDHVKRFVIGIRDLKNGNSFSSVISLMRSCPNMTFLVLILDPSLGEGEVFESADSDNCTLDHLRQIQIIGFEGESAELKLIEFLLLSSPQLVKLEIVKDEDCDREGKISEELMMFPRASSEAEVIVVVDELDDILMKIMPPSLFD